MTIFLGLLFILKKSSNLPGVFKPRSDVLNDSVPYFVTRDWMNMLTPNTQPYHPYFWSATNGTVKMTLTPARYELGMVVSDAFVAGADKLKGT